MKAKYDFSKGERGKFYNAKAVFQYPQHSRKDVGQKMRLDNKIAIVTGAGRGIGKAVALRFAEEGAKVVVDDVNAINGTSTVAAINEAGGEALFVNADVSDATQAESLIASTVDAYGTVHILVNNAICSTADVLNNNWEANLAVALQGTSHCSNAAIPVMQQNSGGSIVNIASVNGLIGLQGDSRLLRCKRWCYRIDTLHGSRTRQRQHPYQLYLSRHDSDRGVGADD